MARAQRTFDAGLVPQVVEGALGRMLEVLRQPSYESVHGPPCDLSILLDSLCLGQNNGAFFIF